MVKAKNSQSIKSSLHKISEANIIDLFSKNL
jgi:hypothetical protein